MAKVLQIRRGNTAQNDNFTGLPGEITMDTTEKTLRVHDGETLGGFTLARADNMATSAENFDITTVSDDFWRDTLGRVMPCAITYIQGNPMILSRLAFSEYIFTMDAVPLFAQAILVCQNAEAGYNPGDEVYAFGIGNHPVLSPNLFRDASGVHVRLIIGGNGVWVTHQSTGVQTNIENDNWRVKFRVYY